MYTVDSEDLELIFKIFQLQMANKTEILLDTPYLGKMYFEISSKLR